MPRPAQPPPAWPAPIVTRRWLVAANLASESLIDREERAGRLVRFGRRGGRGEVTYRVEDVEAWLAGTTGDPPPPSAPPPRRRADGTTSDAMARIVAMARGGKP